jgi:hypothetical protein
MMKRETLSRLSGRSMLLSAIAIVGAIAVFVNWRDGQQRESVVAIANIEKADSSKNEGAIPVVALKETIDLSSAFAPEPEREMPMLLPASIHSHDDREMLSTVVGGLGMYRPAIESKPLAAIPGAEVP